MVGNFARKSWLACLDRESWQTSSIHGDIQMLLDVQLNDFIDFMQNEVQ